MPTESWLVRSLTRIYAAMLLAYPSQFRCEYGREMMLAFNDRVRDRLRHDGARSVVTLMLQIICEWIVTVVRERADADAPCTLRLGDDPVLSTSVADESTSHVSLMLAILGAFLLIVGWYQWAHLMTPFGR